MTICDRCQKEATRRGLVAFFDSRTDTDVRLYGGEVPIDLCDSCLEGLKKVVVGYMEKEEEKLS